MAGDCFDWEAWYDRMPGVEDDDLHVAGTCRLPSSSIRARLEPAEVGVAPEPDLIALRLVLTRPDVGDDLVTERTVSWQGKVGLDIRRVRIEGEAEAEIEVRIAE